MDINFPIGYSRVRAWVPHAYAMDGPPRSRRCPFHTCPLIPSLSLCPHSQGECRHRDLRHQAFKTVGPFLNLPLWQRGPAHNAWSLQALLRVVCSGTGSHSQATLSPVPFWALGRPTPPFRIPLTPLQLRTEQSPARLQFFNGPTPPLP